MKNNRKDWIEHYSQAPFTNTIQKIDQRAMVLVSAEQQLHPEKWKGKNISHVVEFALEQVFGEENKFKEALNKIQGHTAACKHPLHDKCDARSMAHIAYEALKAFGEEVG